jgi:hypothetical protein
VLCEGCWKRAVGVKGKKVWWSKKDGEFGFEGYRL